MLMRGDVNKMMEEVNKVLAGAFKRIEALEDRLMRIESVKTAPKPKQAPKKQAA